MRHACLLGMMVTLIAAGCNAKTENLRPPRTGVPGLALSDNWKPLPPRAGEGLVADPESPIPDVPMPIGFRPLPRVSHVSASPSARQVHHVYQGVAKLPEVVVFYDTVLPSNDWRPVGRLDQEGGVILGYRKGTERLDIRANRKRGVMTLMIDIQPQ